MIVDIGGGTCEVAMIIARRHSPQLFGAPGRGGSMDDAIMSHMKRVYNLLIGERNAEEAENKDRKARIQLAKRVHMRCAAET